MYQVTAFNPADYNVELVEAGGTVNMTEHYSNKMQKNAVELNSEFPFTLRISHPDRPDEGVRVTVEEPEFPFQLDIAGHFVNTYENYRSGNRSLDLSWMKHIRERA
jgi:hypothetical protein